MLYRCLVCGLLGIVLVAALVVGAMLVALYKETTGQRTERAAASLGRACEAIVREIRVPREGGTDAASVEPDYLSSVTRALEPFTGVEGGVWKTSSGSLAYAFPTYEGSGKKTDLPQAEEPTIREVVGTAVSARRPVQWGRDARSQILLIRACPLADAESEIAAWTMTRVITVGGRPFLLATTGLAFLLTVLIGSAALPQVRQGGPTAGGETAVSLGDFDQARRHVAFVKVLQPSDYGPQILYTRLMAMLPRVPIGADAPGCDTVFRKS